MADKRKILEDVVRILVDVEVEELQRVGFDGDGYQAINDALIKLREEFDEVPDLIERFTAGRLGRP